MHKPLYKTHLPDGSTNVYAAVKDEQDASSVKAEGNTLSKYLGGWYDKGSVDSGQSVSAAGLDLLLAEDKASGLAAEVSISVSMGFWKDVLDPLIQLVFQN